MYVCYTLVNSSTVAIDPLDLIDNFDTSEFQPVAWVKPPGFLLQPGETLTPTSENGLIRPITVVANQSTYAGWGVASADGSHQQQVREQPDVDHRRYIGHDGGAWRQLTAGATAANCSTPAITLPNYQSRPICA